MKLNLVWDADRNHDERKIVVETDKIDPCLEHMAFDFFNGLFGSRIDDLTDDEIRHEYLRLRDALEKSVVARWTNPSGK